MLAKQLQGAAKSAVPQYIEDVFSTWLYTGTGATQTITNGIDLSGKGGIVWIAGRSVGDSHPIYTTNIGTGKTLFSVVTSGTNVNTYNPASQDLMSFNSNGFTLGTDWAAATNTNGVTKVSWTFRKQAKFFDVVTYTGNGSNRTIAHNLGSVPGTIIIKRTDTTGAWAVYHRSLANTEYLVLDTTAAKATGATYWNSTTPTSTVFSLGTATDVNANAGTYVAYLFAHDAGGFGTAGTDNVISCGSYVGNGSATGPVVTLGYEPQFVLIKSIDSTIGDTPWLMLDVMRGMPNATSGSITATLLANSSSAETNESTRVTPIATGFTITNSNYFANGSGKTYIYIAIRRGPMRTPTSGTSVFSPVAFSGTGTNSRQIDSGFPPDLLLDLQRNQVVSKYWYTRLFGNGSYLASNNTNEATGTSTAYGAQFDKIQNGYQQGTSDSTSANATGTNYVNHLFRRAPGFFDVVCYTGNDVVGRNISHNLAAIPELIIVKLRTGSTTQDWAVYTAPTGNTKYMRLNDTLAATVGSAWWNNTTPTNTVFTVGNEDVVNNTGWTYVAYLFATVTGVSKVGSYDGNGTSKTIDCGFTAGARFVLIKRTDSTGNWVTFDTARGIVSGNDPALYLNSTAAEVTGIDAIDPDNSGFIVNQETTFNLNVNNATYIFLAIA